MNAEEEGASEEEEAHDCDGSGKTLEGKNETQRHSSSAPSHFVYQNFRERESYGCPAWYKGN